MFTHAHTHIYIYIYRVSDRVQQHDEALNGTLRIHPISASSISKHTNIRTNTYTQTHARTHARTNVYDRAHGEEDNIYRCPYTSTTTLFCKNVNTYMYRYKLIQIHTHTHTQTHTHAYTYINI